MGVSTSPDTSSHILKYFSRKKKSELSPTEEFGHINSPAPPDSRCSFVVAVSEDRNRKCRKTMEDAHTFIYNFGDICDSGYFGLFDGHAGSACADFCAKRLHIVLDNWIKRNDRETLRQLEKKDVSGNDDTRKLRTDLTPAHALSSAFLEVDAQVGKMSMQNAGSTAAVAVLRWEDVATGVPVDFQPALTDSSSSSPSSLSASSSLSSTASKISKFVLPSRQAKKNGNSGNSLSVPIPSASISASSASSSSSSSSTTHGTSHAGTSPSSVHKSNNPVDTSSGGVSPGTVPSITSGCTAAINTSSTAASTRSKSTSSSSSNLPPQRRRVLYVGNVGDSRVVLCRAGRAYRLTYDHKGSDPRESRRIANSGGIMMNNRVNGVLAVTRSLGDTYMKDLVTGAPYTTETILQENDEFMIIACDGLWDVCTDQKAVDLVRDIKDPKEASDRLVEYALDSFSSDNLTVMVVRLDQTAFVNPISTKEAVETPEALEPQSALAGSPHDTQPDNSPVSTLERELVVPTLSAVPVSATAAPQTAG
ncbi:type 2C protein phosphatase PTC1 [Sugiyamaella lignohabitans]|uniref:Type 2C protein phosphatase PTC1 n=1 Tax=Sugiyamaella lignohabitans TaxID=796027 RepID=A0A167FYF4_9ASCO|nr:type 2C protein phosphatase PTC1 [Sugiyamaella lignohabitans]ANB15862.1 type 2C protein phosphatase PTC1 [Sugiyamaella lignohabitans]